MLSQRKYKLFFFPQVPVLQTALETCLINVAVIMKLIFVNLFFSNKKNLINEIHDARLVILYTRGSVKIQIQ